MKDFAHRHPVLAFFALAYLGSWLGWSPWWLSESGIGILPLRLPFEGIALVNQVGLFAGPFTAALIMTRVLEGPKSTRAFLARAFSFRGRRPAYLVALLAVPLIVATPYLLLTGGNSVGGLTASTLAITVVTYLTYLLGGPIQEEPGWRGFALPRLQGSMHPLSAAVGLGVVHTFWHAPLFLTEEWDTSRSDVGQLADGLIPGPGDHDLGQRQTLKQVSHPGALVFLFLSFMYLHDFYTRHGARSHNPEIMT